MSKSIQVSIDIDESDLSKRVKKYHDEAVARCLEQLMGSRLDLVAGKLVRRQGAVAEIVEETVANSLANHAVKFEKEIEHRIAQAFDQAVLKAIDKAATHLANKMVFGSDARTKVKDLCLKERPCLFARVSEGYFNLTVRDWVVLMVTPEFLNQNSEWTGGEIQALYLNDNVLLDRENLARFDTKEEAEAYIKNWWANQKEQS